MPFYAVANGRNVGVYDNWEDCKEQVHGYSKNDFKKFKSPNAAWDFVDQHSSSSNQNNYSEEFHNRAIVPKNNASRNQVATKNDYGETRTYQHTDYMEGKNSIVVRERTYTSGYQGNNHFVEKSTRTYWKSK